MKISKNGRLVETKDIDFGKLKEAQVKGLTDLFSMMAANIEYIKKLEPQFEKLDKSKPNYLQ
jgi:division protein CdvB (Snf7/Vps24/ESCRT-III family)